MSKTKDLADALSSGAEEPTWETEIDWVGSGQDVELGPLSDVLILMRTEFEQETESGKSPKGEEFEGRFAGPVHHSLRDLPIETLDDPGFWRYLSLRYFWWFIVEREGGAVARGNVMTYVDGGLECVPFRMFLRAQSIRDGDDYSLASSIPAAADFWRSHVLRVRTGMTPQLARSFTRLQVETRMPSTSVRPFAKKINRLWSNIVFDIWSEDDCDKLMRELYEEVDVSGDASVPPRIQT